MSKNLKEPVEVTDVTDSAETPSNDGGSNGPVKMTKTLRTKACFNCGKPVDPLDQECPHCKATGKSSNVNSAKYFRIILGFFLGLILWIIFYM